MQIKLTTDYAMRMLTYLAEKKAVASSGEISEALNIPQPYVQSIGRKLKNENYINITIGPFGGLSLIKDPEEITVYDIVMLIEQSITLNRCLENERFCSRHAAQFCSVHAYFSKVQDALEENMKAKTLASFLE
ncbi:MAG: Rrf2 family transcriptional regulator [Clostridiales bacterium]|jgi:Rrf2 family protein|nr:Rrf2 family transcriptional regulator [Clostridiales bacterium]